MSARIVRALSRLVPFWMAAWFFDVGDVSQFAVWLALGTFASVLGDIGLSEHLVRSHLKLRGESSGLLRSAIRARALSGGLAALVVLGGGSIALGAWPDRAIFGAFSYGLAIGLGDFIAAARRSQAGFGMELVESAYVAGSGLAGATLSLVLGWSFPAFETCLGVTGLIVALVRLFRLWGGERSEADRLAPLWRILEASRWLWIRALVGWAFLDASTVVLSFVAGPDEVARFASAARLVGLMTQPLLVVSWVFTAALSHESGRGSVYFGELTRRTNLICLAAIPGGIAACVLVGNQALGALESTYRSAEPVLLVLALGFAVNSGLLSSAPLIVRGAERGVLVASLLGMLVCASLLLPLAERTGAMGAATAVAVGLIATKVGTAILYSRWKLPMLGRGGWVLLPLVALWIAVSWSASGRSQLASLGIGGLASLATVFLMLRSTRIFVHVDP